MSDAYLAPAASHRYVLDLVRNADRDRFLGALFAPEPARTDLLALLAFNHELSVLVISGKPDGLGLRLIAGIGGTS